MLNIYMYIIIIIIIIEEEVEETYYFKIIYSWNWLLVFERIQPTCTVTEHKKYLPKPTGI